MNEEIEEIFQGKITVDKKDIPISFMKYTGNSIDYIVYYNDGDTPCYSEDDEVVYSKNELEFNIYTKGNYLNIVKELKKILKGHNYDWLGDEGDLYETDTKYHHFVVTFEKLRRI
jgi:hypothetical protein